MRKASMNRVVPIALLLAAGLAAAPLAVAQVYKWTDERGSVNYGNKPPPNARNVTLVREDDGRVSTVPGLVPDAVTTTPDQRRIDRLERELDAERRANRSAQGDALSYQAWREQCLAERRVDCDDPNRGSTWVPGPGFVPGYPVYPVPPIARPPINRPVPVPPQQQQPWPAPGGPVVVSPPAVRPDARLAIPQRPAQQPQ
jgi:hypothetical protein